MLLNDTSEAVQLKNSLIGVHRAIQQFEAPVAATEWLPEDRLRVPHAHRGLLFTLPTFRQITSQGYESPEQLAVGIGSADFRRRAFDTNWGPAVVAVEHHVDTLQHCWIACTPQVPQSHYELARQFVESTPKQPQCHRVSLTNPNSILDVQQVIKKVYAVEAPAADLAPADLIADITGGLSTITGGIVLATLDDDRPIEYLTQGTRLVPDGRALTRKEIRDRQLLVAIRTSGEMVRGVLL